ncbi:hypothetical protein ACKI2N_028240 [Cupriavidus sp. 30B13]|uniref:hypothetical protein n=1 Tax=Cupriavidus sp. 30B13 TaxID=3384241 RepID=UPI003B90B587
MRTLGLLFAASVAMALPLRAGAAGCQYDMQCKGERICQQGQCVAPDDDTDGDQARPPASRPAQVPPATSTPASARMSRSAPPPADPQYCCTVAGKLKPYGGMSAGAAVGDACQGATNSGKPVPGTACQ